MDVSVRNVQKFVHDHPELISDHNSVLARAYRIGGDERGLIPRDALGFILGESIANIFLTKYHLIPSISGSALRI